jgi:hypothetical protein
VTLGPRSMVSIATEKSTAAAVAALTAGMEREADGPIERVLVTGAGHWRGEGLALVEKIHPPGRVLQ